MSKFLPFLRKNWKTIAVIGAKLAFIAALFVFLFRPQTFGLDSGLFKDLTPASVWAAVRAIDPATAAFWFGFAMVMKLAGIFAGITRWRILLRAQGVHIPYWYLTKCWFWGRAIGLVLPGTLGLDGYRLVESSRHTGEVIKCATVIAVEKLTGFIALFSLVFLTLPLGLRLFPINLALLAAVLLVLACFIAGTLLLLLQPRIIQVLVASLPVPGSLRGKVNKLAVAATAYSAHRGALFRALGLGLCVHLGICLMYFGTASAIRAENTGILEILFASPLLIVGSVFAPTVSGVGVREVVMTTLLGPGAGHAQALLFGHLGMWFGEVIPFILSLPLLILTGRPNREALLEEIAEVRAAAGAGADGEADHQLPPEVLKQYRGLVLGALWAGALAGLIAGAAVGLVEAGWVWRTLPGLADAGIFLWPVLVYGLIFAAAGKGAALGLVFLYLLADRFPPVRWTYALAFAAAAFAGGAVIGLYRVRRDVFDGHMPDAAALAMLAGGALALAAVGAALLFLLARALDRVTARPLPRIAAGVALYGIFILAGLALARSLAPALAAAPFTPVPGANGPNLILIAVDTLRADYLPAYNPEIETRTPNIDAFLADAIRFERGYAQASWTKASFGSIFSGMYPECHTAFTKTARLPEDVETVAELLQAGGYYTQGFANNPNITALFGYDQGFVEYVDLKKSLRFGATDSAAKLAMYEVLLKAREIANRRLRRPIEVTDYYQPAPAVKDEVLRWLDSGAAPDGTPFFLFAHFMDPHDPFMDPDSPDGGYGRKRLGNPDPEIYLEKMRRAYILEIERLDAALGELFAGLKARGLYGDTLIVLTADHGEEFHEHGGWWHGQTLYEEQTRVPFIIKLPGNARAGEVNPHFARNLDLAPTFLHFAGLEKGAMMQGQALFDAAGNPTNANIGYSYAENNFEGIVLQSVQTPTHKLIRANEGNKRNLAPREFYDLVADPREQTSRDGEPALAPIQSQLDQTIDGYLKICEENAIDPTHVEIDAATLEALDAIGYLDN
ncbi:MAG: sulfatase-like hydrolase/transferase [Candidatus Hydrogenedentes bacterium]|nr:sulfatase-like hydrolase/transferase [Candidatus Hydrogenedentota bacterium]